MDKVEQKQAVLLALYPCITFLRCKHTSCVLTNLCMYLLYHSLQCTQGCDPVNKNTDAKFKLQCQGNQLCHNIVWNTDILNDKDWPVSVINEISNISTVRQKCC